ncbi:hypothetical protein NQ315_002066 [Exocentrus adspersus]|uniref:Uncharacterized protein n=1 Tax=Exocentrus adspersus TaxID=1586481 RepID=A0AAV8VFQ5_9CUCU|nr:hypothetical protein NQ315_002066 [Exocentrus adspersus]
MFSECIHSLADTINQLILAYGIHKSVQKCVYYHDLLFSKIIITFTDIMTNTVVQPT